MIRWKRNKPTRESAKAGPVFFEFIEKQLLAEMERRKSLEARGISVLTTSGTLVTIIFALGALVTNVSDYRPSAVSVWALAAALLAFVIAAMLGLLANRLRWYDVVEAAQMHVWRQSEMRWNDAASKAQRLLAKANIETLRTLRDGNDDKASLIEAALWAQLAAIIALSVAVTGALMDAL